MKIIFCVMSMSFILLIDAAPFTTENTTLTTNFTAKDNYSQGNTAHEKNISMDELKRVTNIYKLVSSTIRPALIPTTSDPRLDATSIVLVPSTSETEPMSKSVKPNLKSTAIKSNLQSRSTKIAASITKSIIKLTSTEPAPTTTEFKLTSTNTEPKLALTTNDVKLTSTITESKLASVSEVAELISTTIKPKVTSNTTEQEPTSTTTERKLTSTSTDSNISTDNESKVILTTSEGKLESTTTEPKLTSVTVEPKQISNTTKPKLASVPVEPKLTATTTEPELTSTFTESNMISTTIKSNLISVTVEPNLTSVTVEPSLTSVTVEPNLTSVTVEPNLTSVNVEPNLTSVTVEPKLIPNTTESKPTLTTAEVKMTSITSESKKTIGTEPKQLSPQKRCEINKKLVFSHHSQCALYYNCSHVYDIVPAYFEQHLQECSFPMLFSTKSNQCENYNTVQCENRLEPKWECQYRHNWCTGSNCDEPCENKYPSCIGMEDGKTVYQPNAWLPYYKECKDQRTIRITLCPRNPVRTLFNPSTRTCEAVSKISRNPLRNICSHKKNGFYLDDYGRCHIYFECNEGKFKSWKKCSRGNVFDETTDRCRNPRKVCGPCGNSEIDCKEKLYHE